MCRSWEDVKAFFDVDAIGTNDAVVVKPPVSLMIELTALYEIMPGRWKCL